jgi:hypothetical protein
MAATTKKTPKAHGAPHDEIRLALKEIATDVRAGGRDLYGDVETLVRSSRRDAVKLGKALRGDVERLAKVPGASARPPRAPHHAAPRRRTTAAHPGEKAAA